LQREPGAAERILLFIPAYRCEQQIARTLAQLEAPWVASAFSQAIVIDNCSPDRTAEVAAEWAARHGGGFLEVLRNARNYGLGGSHKVAFDYALRHGFDWILVLHGDDQGRLEDFRAPIESGAFHVLDGLLGSRFAPGARLSGYSRLRRAGNIVFNALYSACLFRPVSDLGAGLNMYRVAALARTGYLRLPDDLTFNCGLLAAQAIAGWRLGFVPISWREDDQVSNVKLVRQSLATLRIALSALFRRRSFVAGEHRTTQVDAYRAEPLHAPA
jgi:glycosyltransferase involved in cell wall biosynthesis